MSRQFTNPQLVAAVGLTLMGLSLHDRDLEAIAEGRALSRAIIDGIRETIGCSGEDAARLAVAARIVDRLAAMSGMKALPVIMDFYEDDAFHFVKAPEAETVFQAMAAVPLPPLGDLAADADENGVSRSYYAAVSSAFARNVELPAAA